MPEIWRFELNSGELLQIDHEFPHEIVKFQIDNQVLVSALLTVVKYRKGFQDHVAIGEEKEIFKKLIPQKSEMVDYSLGHHGSFVTNTDGFFKTVYIVEGEKYTKLFSEKEYLRKFFPDIMQQISRPKSFTVPSSDNLDIKIPIHIYQPPGENNKRKLPVILHLHGGPEAHQDPDYYPHIQYFTYAHTLKD